ncbi:aspartate kinase [Anaerobranca californiensis DSM 14826]|uniref:Aspartokinase n=1 Tax=Anaerobranca californiensis DSM 14826 TaxID=1120989 RepID=A0A1M6RVP2_9FIRM|nr:aspartate kinase [Anaerobranca californiensis]SHK36438.1 aspartate kinase [Anaerobranca californiensis DSM 14826]
MAVIVQKYGGSSVETIEKMKNVAKRIIKAKEKGNDVVVVVSAMGKTTNELLRIASEAAKRPSKREIDMLISTGEQVSISLLSMILNDLGYPAISLTGFQAGIKTKGVHTKNKICDIEIEKITKHLGEGKIVVVAGFQGLNDNGDITTLGRGGSDTTAVALAAKLGCQCEIYTDVDGIYSVDPRVYKKAKKLSYISYEEMIEMSHLGAKVMEPRSVEIGQCYQVPIYVASSLKDCPGTYIKEVDKEMEERGITGLSISENVLMITLNNVPYTPTNVAEVFALLAKEEIVVDMISQTSPNEGVVNISFTTSKDDLLAVEEVILKLKEKFPTLDYQLDTTIIKLSVVGSGMRTQWGIAAKLFELFAQKGIEFKQVTTSEISISYTINKEYKDVAVQVIAEHFNL